VVEQGDVSPTESAGAGFGSRVTFSAQSRCRRCAARSPASGVEQAADVRDGGQGHRAIGDHDAGQLLLEDRLGRWTSFKVRSRTAMMGVSPRPLRGDLTDATRASADRRPGSAIPVVYSSSLVASPRARLMIDNVPVVASNMVRSVVYRGLMKQFGTGAMRL
jgi:hypothetical protein